MYKRLLNLYDPVIIFTCVGLVLIAVTFNHVPLQNFVGQNFSSASLEHRLLAGVYIVSNQILIGHHYKTLLDQDYTSASLKHQILI